MTRIFLSVLWQVLSDHFLSKESLWSCAGFCESEGERGGERMSGVDTVSEEPNP